MNKHQVTHPDGTKSTRNSKNRTYTHAIEITSTPADRIERIEGEIAHSKTQIARYQDKIAENGGNPIAPMVTATGRVLDGTHDYNEYIAGCERFIAKCQAEIADEQANGTTDYYIHTWCGRYDLAVLNHEPSRQRRAGPRGATMEVSQERKSFLLDGCRTRSRCTLGGAHG